MTLPTAPSRTMSAELFDTTTDAFIGALPQFETDMNVLAVAMSLNATTDTSVSSVLIGTGAKSFTVSSGKSFWPGMWLVIADTAAPTTNAMFCQVTSYSGTDLVVNSYAVQGSGTIASWQISQSAPAALGGLYAALAGSATQDFSAQNLTVSGRQNLKTGANIASAATINLATATGNLVHITGTTPTSAVTMTAGQWMRCIADGAWLLTYHATTNRINSGVDYTLAAGDTVDYFYDGTTVIGNITLKNGKSVVADSFGQTNQDVKASRAIGSTYTNTTGRMIFFSVSATYAATGGYMQALIDSVLHSYSDQAGGAGALVSCGSVPVPPGSTYGVANVSGTPTLYSWKEVR